MKFSTRIDKEVTAEQMFDALADFDRIERMLMRRGVSVSRLNDISAGARAWDLAFSWRGQRRELQLVLVQFDRPERAGPDRAINALRPADRPVGGGTGICSVRG